MLVGIALGAANLHNISQLLRQRYLRFFAENRIEAFSLEILHGNEWDTILFAHLVHGDDVGVL
jgi:hypothetical protein